MLVLLRAVNWKGTTNFHDFGVRNKFRHLAQNIYDEQHIILSCFSYKTKEKALGMTMHIDSAATYIFIYLKMYPEHGKELT